MQNLFLGDLSLFTTETCKEMHLGLGVTSVKVMYKSNMILHHEKIPKIFLFKSDKVLPRPAI